MHLRFITVCLVATLLTLTLSACGQETTPVTSPSTVDNSQSSPTPAVTPQPVGGNAATSTPVSSSSASVIDSTYSRRTPFVPLDQPAFLAASESSYLPDGDLVLGLEWLGEARAYPIRMLTYHHIVNDTVAGRPVLITY